MLRFLRSGLAISSRSLPRELLFWPYALILKYLKILIKSLDAELWLRNSLRLNYWEFAQSDIDLSIWVSGGPREALRAWDVFKTKRSILLGGEVQIYASTWVAKMLPYANQWEVSRDPDLLVRSQFVPSMSGEIEKLVFLVKMLSSDKELWISPSARQKKWHYHFGRLGIQTEPVITGEVVCRLIYERFDFLELDYATFKDYFRSPRSVPTLPTEASDLDRLLNPNRYCWFAEATEQDLIFLEKFGTRGHQYLAAMISWEIWGLFPLTQVTQGLTPLQLEGHLVNQRRLLDHLVVPTEKLGEGLELLQSFYSEINGRY